MVCHFQLERKRDYTIALLDFTLKRLREWQSVGLSKERERNGAQINASSIRSWRWRAKFLQVFFLFYFLSHTVYFLLLQSKLSPSYFSPLSATQVQVPGNRKPIFFIFVISHVPGVEPNRYNFKTVWIFCVQTYLRVYLSIQCRKVISNKGQHKNPLVFASIEFHSVSTYRSPSSFVKSLFSQHRLACYKIFRSIANKVYRWTLFFG